MGADIMSNFLREEAERLSNGDKNLISSILTEINITKKAVGDKLPDEDIIGIVEKKLELTSSKPIVQGKSVLLGSSPTEVGLPQSDHPDKGELIDEFADPNSTVAKKINYEDQEESEQVDKKLKQTTLVMGTNKEFWDKVEITDTEFPPWFKTQNGLTCTFALRNPKNPPRKHVDKYGKDQFLWHITLKAITPKSALDERDGGNPVYTIGQDYTFSMGQKAMNRFKQLHFDEEGEYQEVNTFKYKRTGQSFQTDYVMSRVD